MAEQLVPCNSRNEAGSVEDLVFVATDRLRERLEKLLGLLHEADLGLCVMEALLVGPHPADPEAFCNAAQGATPDNLMDRMRDWFDEIESRLNVAIARAIAINESRQRLRRMIFSENEVSGRQLKAEQHPMSKYLDPITRPLVADDRRR